MHGRSRIEVMLDMLEICKVQRKKTHIMYKANLSFLTLDKYLKFFLEEGFVRKELDDLGSNVFLVTEKGSTLASKIREIQLIMERVT